MKNFSVIIFPAKTGDFFTSYAHPLTKKRIRNNFKTREEAKSHKEEIERKFTRRQFNDLMGLNIGELLNLFMLEEPNNPLTKYSKLHFADFANTFGEFEVEKVTTDALKIWLDQIQSENNLKEISVRKIKCDFDSFFRFLVSKEIIQESPMTGIFYKRFTPPIFSRNILSEDEIKKILESVKEFSPGYLYPLIMMFAETGAKSTEVIELNWKDLDLEKKIVHFKQTSSSRERTLKISEELANALSKRKSKQGYIFLTYYGESFTKSKLGRAVTEFKVKSKFPKEWSASDLRHSFAVNFLMKGNSLPQLQYILGHYNVHLTKQLYGEVAKKVLSRNSRTSFNSDTVIH